MISYNLKKRFWTSSILFFLMFLIIKYDFFLIYSLILFGVLSILEFTKIIKKITTKISYFIFLNASFSIYIFFFCFMFYFFSTFPQLKLILFAFLLTCISSDIGGFVFGKILKGPKLSKISPNKTYAGVLGSLIFSSVTLKILFFYFTQNWNFEVILIAIIISVFCQLGDLFFSFLKRKAKLKDTGNFLPGHGGVLDRFDGIFLGIPLGFLSLITFYQ